MPDALIPLTQGKVAVVDAADAPRLLAAKWFFDGRYAKRTIRIDGKRKSLYLHRVVADAPEGVDVDHADRDVLNCRRSNLRLATRKQNLANMRRPVGVSGFKGVTKDKARWAAKIMVDYRWICLGTFDTPEEAARAYDVKAQEIHGAFAALNFPGG